MQNYRDGAIKVASQTQHFIRTMSPPADLLQLPFFAMDWRPTCWYVAQQMTKWWSVLFQHVWLQIIYIQIFVKAVCILVGFYYKHFRLEHLSISAYSELVSFSLIHFSVSFISTSLAQPYCMAYTSLSFACPINENNQRRTCNMYLHIHLDWNLAAF